MTSNNRPNDLNVAASGYGYSDNYYCPDGIPVEAALFAVLAAFAVAFGILFRAITAITGGRRKRSNPEDSLWNQFHNYVWLGRFLSKVLKNVLPLDRTLKSTGPRIS